MFSSADIARCRSAAYRVLAQAFTPSESELDQAVKLRGAAVLPDLLEACGARKLRRLARRLAHTWPSPELHERLFSPGSTCGVPPYEASYRQRSDHPAEELETLSSFLSELIDATTDERADHVACECEMMSFLAEEEAAALDRHDEDMVGLAREAENTFLRDHLIRFAPVFAERLKHADPDGFYGGMGRVLRAFVEWDCVRCGVDVTPRLFRASP